MSEKDFDDIHKGIESEIKKANARAKKAKTLAEKIEAKRILKDAQAKLKNHRLSYFDFVQ
jgi:hypothetical protein